MMFQLNSWLILDLYIHELSYKDLHFGILTLMIYALGCSKLILKTNWKSFYFSIDEFYFLIF